MPYSTPSDRLEIVRRNLKIAIAMRDTTHTEVSRKAGLSLNVVGSFLRATTSISFENMLAVCDVLNIPASILERADGITPGRLRLHQTLQKLPDALADSAMQILDQELERSARAALGQEPRADRTTA
jgi:DNA-binding Xre family transcriptional regulator